MCCPIQGNDGDDGPSAFQCVVRRARKPHKCVECREAIPIGARYEHASGIWDGRADSYKTCLSCIEIRDHFACDGYYYGQIWEDVYGNFFPDMKCGGPCMDGLSPAAKARLIDMRMAWLFDEKPDIDGASPPWHPPLADPPDPLPPPRLAVSGDLALSPAQLEAKRHHDDIQRELEIKVQLRVMFPEPYRDDDDEDSY
jgi:hypothetical protein